MDNKTDSFLNCFFISLLGVLISLVFMAGYEIRDSQLRPTTVTPNSKFVVQEIRAKDGQWNYTLKNINLQSSNELPILTIQTSTPYGYKTGDTLQVLNYNIPKLNNKLQ